MRRPASTPSNRHRQAAGIQGPCARLRTARCYGSLKDGGVPSTLAVPFADFASAQPRRGVALAEAEATRSPGRHGQDGTNWCAGSGWPPGTDGATRSSRRHASSVNAVQSIQGMQHMLTFKPECSTTLLAAGPHMASSACCCESRQPPCNTGVDSDFAPCLIQSLSPSRNARVATAAFSASSSTSR